VADQPVPVTEDPAAGRLLAGRFAQAAAAASMLPGNDGLLGDGEPPSIAV